MKHSNLKPLAALLISTAISLPCAFAQDKTADSAEKKFVIKETQPNLGSHIKRPMITGSSIPFDQPWENLTAEQKKTVRSMYENMPETDEPPFPLHGTASIYTKLGEAYRAIATLAPVGTLSLFVNIDSKGEAQNVEIQEKIDHPQFMQFAAAVAIQTKYKPAKCGAQACAMAFPIRLTFHR